MGGRIEIEKKIKEIWKGKVIILRHGLHSVVGKKTVIISKSDLLYPLSLEHSSSPEGAAVPAKCRSVVRKN